MVSPNTLFCISLSISELSIFHIFKRRAGLTQDELSCKRG